MIYEFGNLRFNTDFNQIKIDEKLIQLTPTEGRMLETLISMPNMTVTRELIIEKLWTTKGEFIETRIVDVYVGYLRKKIKEANLQIKAIYGLGYCLCDGKEIDW